MNKKDLSERDICSKFIGPAVKRAGWDGMMQIREEVAFTKGQNRILLVMATGTGKTYTAFQIIWRLWKAGRKKCILFLADRNVLIDQTLF